ncbi:hypothetical protein [Motilibacter aurantiacus]|uniref:hypothetical protein n=1 Tax=Motilibacter aurantiacus TaxID=2714955 RepID=UPI00140C5184|nr:hypothetical protein [Motilibacter aurantiacus]NHC44928.1 hypothetical protein [Motilibacter aurantiacus]
MRGLGRIFSRGSRKPVAQRSATSEDERHLREFAASRTGVEAYVEPPTAVTTTTVVYVANTGEWTRRRVRDAHAAHALANALGIPSYDASVVGYPQRMRAWNARKAAEEKTRRTGTV